MIINELQSISISNRDNEKVRIYSLSDIPHSEISEPLDKLDNGYTINITVPINSIDFFKTAGFHVNKSELATRNTASKIDTTNTTDYNIYRFKNGDNYLILQLYNVIDTVISHVQGQLVSVSSNDKLYDVVNTSKFMPISSYAASVSSNDSSEYGYIFIIANYYNKRAIGLLHFSQTVNKEYVVPVHFRFIDYISDSDNLIINEYNTDYGDYSKEAGYSYNSDTSDTFGVPELPNLGLSNSGMINVYNIDTNELSNLSNELFPNFSLPSPSTKEGIEAVAENLANTVDVIGSFVNSFINENLVNYVLDCHIIPVNPVVSNKSVLKVGFKIFDDILPEKVTSDYVSISCGGVDVKEVYQNFLDYNCKIKLYLPFVGFIDINPQWCMDGKLNVLYHFNVIDGSFISFVIASSNKTKLSSTVVATYGGNCCIHLPITGLNYASMISGVVSGVSKIASGNTFGGIETVLSSKPSYEQSNSYNANTSFMTYRTPYLLIERPTASFSKNFPKENGLPLNVTYKLSNLSGFTKCNNPILDDFEYTQEEKTKLFNLLTSGIIL